MYRVLVVDDEPAIVKGMAKLVTEIDEFELEVYKAHSAIEALEVAKEVRLDLVLSDIRMPGMSGIELYAELKIYWPSCRFIFLTGYSDFDYAYSVLHMESVNYILKTENDDVILKTIKDAIIKIKENREQQVLIELAMKQMQEMAPLLKRDLYENLVLGEGISEDLLFLRFNEAGISLSPDEPLILVIGRIDNNNESASYAAVLNMLYNVKDLLLGSFSSVISFDCSIVESTKLILFIQPDTKLGKFILADGKADWESLSVHIKGSLEAVQDVCKEKFGFTVSFVISRGELLWGSLNEEYSMLRSVITRRLAKSQQMIINLGKPNKVFKIEQKRQMAEQTAFEQKRRELENYLDNGNEVETDKISREMLNIVKLGFKESYLPSLERYYQLLLVFVSYINKYNLSEYMEKDIHPNRLLTLEIPEDWEKEERFFAGMGRYLCMLKKKLAENQDIMVVNRLNKFISENPGDNLSLTRLADLVYLNPSYLSRFYKQFTGKNLTDYINEVRIEAAKRLLKDTNLKVNEVAQKLGYESASYFTSLFKRIEGITPQEHRVNLIDLESGK